jgi:hypothetical protein
VGSGLWVLQFDHPQRNAQRIDYPGNTHYLSKVTALRIARARPRTREFCTIVHRFAQRFDQNLIDAADTKFYLAPQIEPEALELYGSVYKAQQA